MRKSSFIACLLLFFWISCTNDTFVPVVTECTEAVTYDSNMQDLIDRNCAYSGCHNGTLGVPGNYTSYQGMEIHFDGSIENRVIARENDTIFGMPPNNVPDGRPKDLTPEDFKLISCWINQDFPEN